MTPSLDIIIVNWNSGEQLRECIHSMTAVDLKGVSLARVVVVDNASQDGSVEGLTVPGVPITVLRNDRNCGFAAACNQGASGSKADYLLFLNPDTRLYRDSLAAPVHYMESDAAPSVGICGVQLIDESGAVARSCVRFPTRGRLLAHFFGLQYMVPALIERERMTDWDHLSTRPVDQVMGAYFLVRRGLFESLKGFDERFFVFYEEMDFSLRSSQAGFTTSYFAGAQVFHAGQGTTQRVKTTALFYLLRSRVLYGYKHFGRAWGTIFLLLTLLVEPVSRSAFELLKRSLCDLRPVASAYLRLWRELPGLKAAEGVWQ